MHADSHENEKERHHKGVPKLLEACVYSSVRVFALNEELNTCEVDFSKDIHVCQHVYIYTHACIYIHTETYASPPHTDVPTHRCRR